MRIIRRIIYVGILLCVMIFLSGSERNMIKFPHVDVNILTLDDVVKLSEKGDNLKWSDLDGYTYYETGCGLCINVYEINKNFSLRVGGAGTYNNGMTAFYFYLESADGDYIEIRNEDVKAFIDEHS